MHFLQYWFIFQFLSHHIVSYSVSSRNPFCSFLQLGFYFWYLLLTSNWTENNINVFLKFLITVMILTEKCHHHNFPCYSSRTKTTCFSHLHIDITVWSSGCSFHHLRSRDHYRLMLRTCKVTCCMCWLIWLIRGLRKGNSNGTCEGWCESKSL